MRTDNQARAAADSAEHHEPNGAGKAAAPILEAAIVAATTVSWLWYPRLPAGQISLLGAPGGGGKGLNACAYAATVTTGCTWPDGAPGPEPAHVLWCETEDPLAQVVVPRLNAAGADLGRVSLASRQAYAGLGDNGLKELIRSRGTRLIVMSPLVSFLQGLADINGELSLRNVLEQLQAAIDGTGCALLGLAHTNKKADLRAVERLLGSVAFTNFVRSVLLVGRDKDDPDWFRLVHAKHNLSLKGNDLLYCPRHVGKNPRDQFVRLDWRRPIENVDTDWLFDRPKANGESRTTARNWLLEYLREHGETPRDEVVIAGAQADHSEQALEKAMMRDHRLQSRRETFPNRAWWSAV